MVRKGLVGVINNKGSRQTFILVKAFTFRGEEEGGGRSRSAHLLTYRESEKA